MFKKILVYLLVACLMFSFTACGSETEDDAPSDVPSLSQIEKDLEKEIECDIKDIEKLLADTEDDTYEVKVKFHTVEERFSYTYEYTIEYKHYDEGGWNLQKITQNSRTLQEKSLAIEKSLTVTVENFVGKHYAEELATDSEFLGTYSPTFQRAYNADYPEGYVFKQDPAPGSKIKMKDTITLWISTGERTAEIPEVRAREHYDDVYKKLKEAGFEVKKVDEVNDQIDVGHVIRINPSYPGEAPVGSEILVYVSIGAKEPDPVKIPDVMNVAVGDAKSRLAASGFNNVKEELVNSTAPKGTVVGVSPKVGEEVSPSTDITLTVSNGKVDSN